MEPRIVIFSIPGGARIFVGIGGPLGGITYYADTSSGISVTARSNQPNSTEDAWFAAVGEQRRFRAWSLLSTDELTRILVYIYESNSLPNWVEWV